MVTAPIQPKMALGDVRSRVAELGSVLGVWAHPDDETYLSGGLMRCALESGQRVTCVNATSGERGTGDPEAWPPDRLASVRRAELAESGCVLAKGLAVAIDHRWLDHPDGRCHELPADVGAEQVGRLIDEIRPDTVLTFDPTGVTGHLDHRAVSDWVTQAARERPGVRVLGATVTDTWVARLEGLVELGEYFYPGFPQPVPDRTVAVELVCDDELWAIKDAAIRAHQTQVAAIADHFTHDRWRAFNDVEAFVDITPNTTDPAAGPPTNTNTTSHDTSNESS
jgi:LmbE family N-acetylglucosaminyl deacetylase